MSNQFGVCVVLAFSVAFSSHSIVGPEWVEPHDAGPLPGDAQSVPIVPTRIKGTLTPNPAFSGGKFDDQDMYLINIIDPDNFYASTSPFLLGSAEFDTQLWLFKFDGTGLLGNDNSWPDDDASNGKDWFQFSTIWNFSTDGTDIVITEPGLYYLAISTNRSKPVSEDGDIFFLQQSGEVSGPDGPGGALPISDWAVIPPSSNADSRSKAKGPVPLEYVIALAGVGAVEPTGAAAHLLATTGESLKIGGNGGFEVNGSVQINSTAGNAMNAYGNAYAAATEFNVVGGVSITGNCQVVGDLNMGSTPADDPFASLPEPDPTGAPLHSSSKLTLGSGTHNLEPGRYIGGISLTGSGVTNFAPGVYYIQGGGVSMNGSAIANIDGALIYNSSNSSPAIARGEITVSGNAQINGLPIADGTYAGMSVFQDRSAEVPPKKIQLGGNGSITLGTVYSAHGHIQLSGNAQSHITIDRLVAWSLQIAGNGSITIGEE